MTRRVEPSMPVRSGTTARSPLVRRWTGWAIGCLALAATARGQGLEAGAFEIAEAERAKLPPLSEGALQSDVFLPHEAAAAVLLARGDGSVQRSRELVAEGSGVDAERSRIAAFDDWFAALREGGAGLAVRPRPEASGNLTEGLVAAVLRRLRGLSAEEARAWRGRFSGPGEASLEAALRSRRDRASLLSAVERGFPHTDAAARAALALADRAFERGQTTSARSWLARAKIHLSGADDGARTPIESAIATRDALLASVDAFASPGRSGGWRQADGLEPRGVLALADPEQELPGRDGLRPRRGVRPGLAWLRDDEVVVQTAGRVHRIALEATGPRLIGTFAPADLVAGELGAWEPASTNRDAPGWALAPAISNDRLVLTAGRASVSAIAEDDAEPNALICASLAEDGARLAWAISGDVRLDAQGQRRVDPRLRSVGAMEFQPGPVISGSLVVVAAREIGAEQRTWLYAFELANGELAWRRFLAQGEDLSRSPGRFGGGPGPRSTEPSPLVVGERVFAASSLGAAALFELVDGRPLWSLATRRRPAFEAGWSASGPFSLSAVDGGVLWDPADSDVLYRLHARALAGDDAPQREQLFLEAPQRIHRAPGEPRSSAPLLLGGTEAETIVLQNRGGAEAVALWPNAGADPIEALHLGPREHVRGSGLVGAQRVLVATERGLYLFDRSRELYLIDYAPLLPLRPSGTARSDSFGASGASGGDVHGRGSRVLVLGPSRLWAFQAR